MRMVLEIMSFIRAECEIAALHLESLEVFPKYVFAHDMLNYGRMMPVYLAEMNALKNLI